MRQKITARQAFLIIVTIVSTSVLQPSFRDFMLWSGNGGWLPISVATVFGIGFVSLVVKLAARFPRQSFAEYAPRVWTPVLGYPLVLTLVVVFFLRGAISLRNISEFFVSAILPGTPISAVMLVMMVLVASALFADLEGIARFNELVVPTLIVTFILVFIGTGRLNVMNFLPLFNKGHGGFMPVFQSVSSDLAIICYILFLYPYLVDPQSAGRIGRRQVGFAGSLLFLTYINALLFLGSSLGSAFTWPYFAVTENLKLIERGEILFVVIWVIIAFVKISLCIYIASLGVSQLIPKLKLKWVGLGLLPIAAYLAIRAGDQPTALANHVKFNRVAFYIELGIPIFTLLLALLRKLGGDTHDKATD